jgi:Tfp pilus assembly protein FimV
MTTKVARMAAGTRSTRWLVLVMVLALAGRTLAETPAEAELRKRLQRLEENQEKLYELLKAKDARLDALEAELKRTKGAKATPARGAPAAAAKAPAKTEPAP